MYQDFNVIDITHCYADSKITVTMSFDIDPTSVNDTTIQVFSKKDAITAETNIIIDKRKISIFLKDEVVPNSEYILKVLNIKSILGQELSSGIRRKLVFSSEVREVPVIMEPADGEEITDLKVSLTTLRESNEVEPIKDKTFFIQVAKDVAFIDIELETISDKTEIDLKDLATRQYFIRARVETIQDGKKEIGKWSETITFFFTKIDEDCDCGDDEPEYIEYTTLVSKPDNGETPESILIEFSGEIDIDSIEGITVIRRDI